MADYSADLPARARRTLHAYRIASKQADKLTDGDLVYSVYRDADEKLHVFRHSDQLGRDPELLLLASEPTMEIDRDSLR